MNIKSAKLKGRNMKREEKEDMERETGRVKNEKKKKGLFSYERQNSFFYIDIF